MHFLPFLFTFFHFTLFIFPLHRKLCFCQKRYLFYRTTNFLQSNNTLSPDSRQFPPTTDLFVFTDNDLLQGVVNSPSSADYLLCTKVSSSEDLNPIVGFAVYYNPTSIIALLANAQVVSLPVLSCSYVPAIENLDLEDGEQADYPIRKVIEHALIVIQINCNCFCR